MQISVLIPTTPKQSLVKLLESLKGQPYAEVLLDFEKGSPAQVRNRLAKKAKGDILLFIDDDVILAPDFIVEGIDYFQKWADIFCGQSKVVGAQENSTDKMIGTAFWVARSLWEKMQGMDEDYPFFNEDVDFFQRVLEAGYDVGFFEKSMCFHPAQGGYEKLIEGNWVLSQKHPDLYDKLKKELR